MYSNKSIILSNYITKMNLKSFKSPCKNNFISLFSNFFSLRPQKKVANKRTLQYIKSFHSISNKKLFSKTVHVEPKNQVIKSPIRTQH